MVMVDCNLKADETETIQSQAAMSLLHHFSIATSIVFLAFGSVYLLKGTNLMLGAFEISLGLAQLFNLLYLRRSYNTLFSARFLVASVYFMSLLIFMTGGLGDTGYLWLLFIPLFTVLLLKQDEAVKWLVFYTLVITVLLAMHFFKPGFELPYTIAELRQTLIVYVLMIYLTYLNERLKLMANEMLLKKNRLLGVLTQTDPLTGLYNRGCMTERLEEVFDSAREKGEVFSILMVDLDHFKRVNDTLGHHAGDRVLKSVSRLFTDYIQDRGAVGRWGGEEFVIVCPGMDKAEAVGMAEALCKKVSAHDFGLNQPVTASFGVVTFEQPKDSLEAMLIEVDSLLYQAKDSGRNCVICVPGEPSKEISSLST